MNLGSYSKISEVWAKYPEGGKEGDTITVSNVTFKWDKYSQNWVSMTGSLVSPGYDIGSVSGDLHVSRHHVVGGDETVRGNSIIKKNLKVEGLLYARIKGADKGLFPSLERLRSSYPKALEGDYAVIGKKIPGPIYQYDGQSWIDTGEVGGNGGTIDLEDYYNKEVVDVRTNEINISRLNPEGGVNGTNRYTLEMAISGVPMEFRGILGFKLLFIDVNNEQKAFTYGGGNFLQKNSWYSQYYIPGFSSIVTSYPEIFQAVKSIEVIANSAEALVSEVYLIGLGMYDRGKGSVPTLALRMADLKGNILDGSIIVTNYSNGVFTSDSDKLGFTLKILINPENLPQTWMSERVTFTQCRIDSSLWRTAISDFNKVKVLDEKAAVYEGLAYSKERKLNLRSKSNSLFCFETANNNGVFPSDYIFDIKFIPDKDSEIAKGFGLVSRMWVVAYGYYNSSKMMVWKCIDNSKSEIVDIKFSISPLIENVFVGNWNGYHIYVTMRLGFPQDWVTCRFDDNSNAIILPKQMDVLSSLFAYDRPNALGNIASTLVKYVFSEAHSVDAKQYVVLGMSLKRIGVYNGDTKIISDLFYINKGYSEIGGLKNIPFTLKYNPIKKEYIGSNNTLGLTIRIGINSEPADSDPYVWANGENMVSAHVFENYNNQPLYDYFQTDTVYADVPVTNGYLNQDTGVITALSGKAGYISGFIAINKENLLTMNLLYDRCDRVCFYSDADETTFISGKYTSTMTQNVVIDSFMPAGANYMRVFGGTLGLSRIFYVPFKYVEAVKENKFKSCDLYIDDDNAKGLQIHKDIQALKSEFEELGIERPLNLIRTEELRQEKKWINNETGGITASSGSYSTMQQFQPVGKTEILTINNLRSIAFYSAESEETFISGIGYPNGSYEIPLGTKFMRYTCYADAVVAPAAYIVDGTEVPDWSKVKLNNVTFPENLTGENVASNDVSYTSLIELALPECHAVGKATSESVLPDDLIFGDAYVAGETNNIFGQEVSKGEYLVSTGNGCFDRVKVTMMECNEIREYDVVIIGGGSAAMGAAYALKDTGKSIAVVEKLPVLGGTATQAGINTWIESVNPPYLKRVFNELKAVNSSWVSGNIDKSVLPDKFAATGMVSGGLVINVDALQNKYATDLEEKVDVMLNTEFVSVAKRINREVESIYVRDLATNNIVRIKACFFVDASGDGVLCRSSNSIRDIDYYFGRDLRSRYGETIAPLSEKYKMQLNEPTYYFQLQSGYDDSVELEKVKTVYRDDSVSINGRPIVKPDYIYSDGYLASGDWVNGMNGMTWEQGGAVLLQEGIRAFSEECIRRRIWEYWKYIKLSAEYYEEQGKTTFSGWNTSQVLARGYKGVHRSYIGIRETFRINCEYMLKQEDLTKLIRSENLGRFIAEGSHGVDFHVRSGLDLTEIQKMNGEGIYEGNGLLRPYGIPYECIIPKKLDNVLVAGRCFGASQIALASARVNKVMAQLGWAAGNAVRICMEDSLKDVRLVNVEKLQSADYTGLRDSIVDLESRYKTNW